MVSGDGCGVGGGSDGGEYAFFDSDAYVLPWFEGTGPAAFASLDAVWKILSDLTLDKTPSVNGQQ